MTSLGTLIWKHPEFDEPRYPGMFPKGCEKRLWRLLGKPNPKTILHVFGGRAEIGVRIDINPSVFPDHVMDAHHLEFLDESFKVVICDPPFSDSNNWNEYKNPDAQSLDMNQWLSEASRVCQKNGFIVVRHFWRTKAPPKCSLWMVVILEQCKKRFIHMVQIFMKDGAS